MVGTDGKADTALLDRKSAVSEEGRDTDLRVLSIWDQSDDATIVTPHSSKITCVLFLSMGMATPPITCSIQLPLYYPGSSEGQNSQTRIQALSVSFLM